MQRLFWPHKWVAGTQVLQECALNEFENAAVESAGNVLLAGVGMGPCAVSAGKSAQASGRRPGQRSFHRTPPMGRAKSPRMERRLVNAKSALLKINWNGAACPTRSSDQNNRYSRIQLRGWKPRACAPRNRSSGSPRQIDSGVQVRRCCRCGLSRGI
jgi:hypothetical protein